MKIKARERNRISRGVDSDGLWLSGFSYEDKTFQKGQGCNDI